RGLAGRDRLPVGLADHPDPQELLAERLPPSGVHQPVVEEAQHDADRVARQLVGGVHRLVVLRVEDAVPVDERQRDQAGDDADEDDVDDGGAQPRPAARQPLGGVEIASRAAVPLPAGVLRQPTPPLLLPVRLLPVRLLAVRLLPVGLLLAVGLPVRVLPVRALAIGLLLPGGLLTVVLPAVGLLTARLLPPAVLPRLFGPLRVTQLRVFR